MSYYIIADSIWHKKGTVFAFKFEKSGGTWKYVNGSYIHINPKYLERFKPVPDYLMNEIMAGAL